MASNATVDATIAAFTAKLTVKSARPLRIVGTSDTAKVTTGFSSVPPGVCQAVAGRSDIPAS